MDAPEPNESTDPRSPIGRAARERREQNLTRQFYRMSGVGLEFVVALCAFGAIGYGLDRWLGTLPWGLLAGLAVGFAAGLYLLVRVGRESFK